MLPAFFCLGLWWTSGQWSVWTIPQRRIGRIVIPAVGLLVGVLLWFLHRELAFGLVDGLSAGLFGAISLLVGVGLVRRAGWTPQERALAAFAVVLIAANALITFAYFRYRSFYLTMIGWVILFALSQKNLRLYGLRTVFLGLSAALIVVNSGNLMGSLPVFERGEFDPYSGPCFEDVPLDLALEVADLYNIDQSAVLECRESLRNQ